MQAIQWLMILFIDISWLFYGVFLEVSSWVWPLNLAAAPFLWISDKFIDLAAALSDFSVWVYEVTQKITQIFSWDTILSLLQPYLSWGRIAWTWVVDAWSNVWNIVTAWWNTTYPIILAWIDIARQEFYSLLNQANAWLANLQASWSSFTTSILPTLARITDVDNLIGSKLREWFPFYDELTSLWSEIKEFFADPEQYVYSKLDEFFERFW